MGARNYNWSRTAAQSSYGYFFYVNGDYIGPSGRDYKFYGFPLRCLYSGSA